jgi:TRAP-type C4-dicarboxylate transport system permease small subunit
MLLMATVVFAQVVLRYLTYQPVAWTEELARLVFIWLSLIGAAEGARRGVSFAVDLLPRNLGGAAGRLLRSMLRLAEAALYATVACAGYRILDVVHYQESVTLAIPMSYAYAAIPLGMGMMAIFALLGAKDELLGKRASR